MSPSSRQRRFRVIASKIDFGVGEGIDRAKCLRGKLQPRIAAAVDRPKNEIPERCADNGCSVPFHQDNSALA